MKSRFHIILLSAALTAFLAACSDLQEIEDRLDSLESRVQAIENLLPTLNGNIEALQKLAGGGTINSVSEKDGEYTLVLSNGDTLRLAQGSIGIGNAPVMTIDSDGYWMVDYGQGAEYLLSGGNKVKAESTTPEIGVDSEGFWTIRHEGGDFERMKDESGNPISARPDTDADAFFRSAKVEGDRFVVVTADGKTITLPIEPDFMYAIKRNGVIVTDVVTLLYDEPVTFDIESKGVASVSVVARPHGVEVTLTETGMTVEAVYNKTKASADTRKDIAILAVSSNGFASIAKVLVEIDETSMPSTTPRAFINQKAATLTTLTFEMKTKNTTTVKYLLKPSADTAPSAEELTSDMTLVEDRWTEITFDNLEIDTEYTLYVLPTGGTVSSGESIEMAECTAKTAAPQPAATVAKTGETYKTLTFSVDLNSDATEYWYRIYPEGETPAGNIEATNKSSETTLTIDGLKAETDYVLEVLAVNGEYKAAESVKTPAKTAAPADYYEMYDAGYDIVVGDVTINKSNYPDLTLLTKASTTKNLKNGVYIVEKDAGCSIGSGINKLIVIGRSFDKKTPLTRTATSNLDGTADSDYLILMNISDEGLLENHNFLINKSDETFEKTIFKDCFFKVSEGKALVAQVNSDRRQDELTLIGCDCEFTNNGYILSTRNTPITKLELTNNVIFSSTTDQSTLRIVDFTGSNLTEITSVKIASNTFYNVIAPGAAQGYLRAKSIESLSITDNLFINCAGTNNHSFLYYSSTQVTSPSASNNLDSEINENKKQVYVVNGTPPEGVTQPTLAKVKLEWNYSDGKYSTDGTYDGKYYGAKR